MLYNLTQVLAGGSNQSCAILFWLLIFFSLVLSLKLPILS